MSVERHITPGRDEWLALRKQDVTASAVGALYGCHDYLTAYGLWAEKTGRMSSDAPDSGILRRGRLLEPVAVEALREERPTWEVTRSTDYFRDTDARLGGTPDVLVRCPERGAGIVQIKTVAPMVFRQKWLDEDRQIAVPTWIGLQASVEAYLTGAKWAAVAVLVVDHVIDLHIIDVPLVDGLMDRVKADVQAFWALCDSGATPDPDYGRDGALIARLFDTDNGSTVDLSTDNHLPELLAEREALKAQEKQASERIKVIETEIRAKVGEATFATLPGWNISLKTLQRKAYEVKATSYRALRIRNTAHKEAAE